MTSTKSKKVLAKVEVNLKGLIKLDEFSKKFENGYLEYTCEFSGELKLVGFTCKSRLYSSCGKKYVDERSEKMSPVKH